MSSTDEIFDIDLNQLESFRIEQKTILERNYFKHNFQNHNCLFEIMHLSITVYLFKFSKFGQVIAIALSINFTIRCYQF
jgi:uncharacterized protein involved in cysteine biosynthesis